ncbi:CCR4-NOT transcription complex subunit 6-like [Schistocerca piceifrons]|uniref:CCR4-NOT transcription complex subunit 6-like n=1 Tax=Schistocerca piceifrons TaxID=274613 RepID=UPI001F5EDC5C|nr:CCR4-NOT transcription complex subunit 6-like [Schistocerca piceifrons]
MSRNHKEKYEGTNSRRAHTIMSPEDAASGKRSDWTELEITGTIRNLSPNLWTFTHLTALYLNDNCLSRIPPDISKLVNLRTLDLSSNKLRSLPAELGDLIYLRELLLNNNYLRVLPYELGKLFQLHILGLQGNPLTKEILAMYGEPNGTHRLLTYMLDNLQEGS